MDSSTHSLGAILPEYCCPVQARVMLCKTRTGVISKQNAFRSSSGSSSHGADEACSIPSPRCSAANPPSSAPLPVDEKVLGSSMLSFCCWFQQWGKAFSMAWPLRAAEDGGFWSGQSRRHEHRARQPSVVTTPACSTSAKAFEPLKKLKEGLCTAVRHSLTVHLCGSAAILL